MKQMTRHPDNGTSSARPQLMVVVRGGIAVAALFVGCGSPDSGASQSGPGTWNDGGADVTVVLEASLDAGHEAVPPGSVKLSGAVQKGPFVLGASVRVSPVDAAGNPTGQVFSTQTNTELGAFDIVFTYTGPVALEATGFYYNEASGRLSATNLTLRGFYEVTAAGTQKAYINLVTHLCYERIRVLMGEGKALVAAQSQAETELRKALGLGGTDFEPGKAGAAMNILGGDDAGNAFLFALSAVVAEVARTTSGSTPIDAALQEFVNKLALDFSAEGAVSAGLRAALDTAQKTLFTDWSVHLLRGRLEAVGSSESVPTPGKALDIDGDGVVDEKDNCPLEANTDQSAVEGGVCGYRASFYRAASNEVSDQRGFVVADFSGDLKKDVLFLGKQGHLLKGDDQGHFDSPIDYTLPAGLQSGYHSVTASDWNGDGRDDLVVVPESNSPGVSLAVYQQNANGSLADVVDGWPQGLPETLGTCYLTPPSNWMELADLNADGRADLIFDSGGCAAVMLSHADGGFEPPFPLSGYDEGASAGRAVDVNDDGAADLVLFAKVNGNYALKTFLNDNHGQFVASGVPLAVAPDPGAHSFYGFPQPQVGDINGDHKPDLLLWAFTTQAHFVAVGDGTGTFVALPPFPSPSPGPSGGGGGLAVIDLNGDELDDVYTGDVFVSSGSALTKTNGFMYGGMSLFYSLGTRIPAGPRVCLGGPYMFGAAAYGVPVDEFGLAVVCGR